MNGSNIRSTCIYEICRRKYLPPLRFLTSFRGLGCLAPQTDRAFLMDSSVMLDVDNFLALGLEPSCGVWTATSILSLETARTSLNSSCKVWQFALKSEINSDIFSISTFKSACSFCLDSRLSLQNRQKNPIKFVKLKVE